MSKHKVTMLLGGIIAIIFLVAIFSYQVGPYETAVVTTFGKITGTTKAGLHFRWPYPVQEIDKFDNRLRCYDGNIGKKEEVLTRDGRNVIIGLYIIYKISDSVKFFNNIQTIETAEARLNSQMRTIKNEIVGQYRMDQLINTDRKKMKFDQMRNQMKEQLNQQTISQYGITVVDVGIKTLLLPEKNTQDVFARMIAERNIEARKYTSAGEKEADKIRYEADQVAANKIALAEAKAKKIRAEGDAKAAEFYSIFNQNPKLAIFLRKLESLKKVMGGKTTLVLGTDSAPFDLLNLNSQALKKQKSTKTKQDKK